MVWETIHVLTHPATYFYCTLQLSTLLSVSSCIFTCKFNMNCWFLYRLILARKPKLSTAREIEISIISMILFENLWWYQMILQFNCDLDCFDDLSRAKPIISMTKPKSCRRYRQPSPLSSEFEACDYFDGKFRDVSMARHSLPSTT